MREGDSWDRRLREGRGGEGNVQYKQNLRITPGQVDQRVNRRRRQHMFVELWSESKATPRLFERRIKEKNKEIETFVTTD
jgi:hypothetical protein